MLTLLNREEGWRLRPHVVQPVERSLFGVEDMNDDTAIVEQNPSRDGITLGAYRADALLGHTLDEITTYCPELSLIVAGANDEEIGDG